MVLNIFPKRRETRSEAEASTETEQQLPEPSAEALAEAPRRGRAPRAAAVPGATPRPRGRKPAAEVTEAPADAAPAAAAPAAEVIDAADAPAPRPRTRTPRRAPAAAAPEVAEAAPEAEQAAPSVQDDARGDGYADDGFSDPDGQSSSETAEGAPQGEGRARRRRGGRGRGRGSRDQAEGSTDQPEGEEPAPQEGDDDQASQPRESGRRERGGRGPAREPRPETVARTEADPASIARSIDAQGRALADLGRQVERLVRTTEDMGRRPGGGGASAPPVRVGVFVDTANIELACDRLRVRFDWGKVLRLVTQDRQLVRAMAYSPIHDDLTVSIETQRFVEPFLDKGFKVVTKPFRRFQDGSIKANLDIELALDVVTMLDRLDVVVLISGDGDFQRLVELAQGRGVRVEVAAVGSSTATNLKHAADSFIDLGARARDLRS